VSFYSTLPYGRLFNCWNQIAGICFTEWLQSSKVVLAVVVLQFFFKIAGGLYNPVILKRFSQVWQAKEQLDYALPFYAAIEQELNSKVDF